MPDRLIAVNLQLRDNYSGPLKGAAAATQDFAKKADGVGRSAAGFDQASRSVAGVASQSRQAQTAMAGVGSRFDQVKSKVRGVTEEMGGLKGALASFGGGVIGGLAAGGLIEGAAQIKDFLGEATEAASDLNETQNKANVIFGKQASLMDSWANGAAKNFGLSKAAALDYASQLGDMFTQLGNSGDQSAQLSQKVVQLAADLGSFNNLDTGDVLERIQAGFRGEYDSLQLLVPNINAARVQQEALADTGKKSASALTGQDKAAATLAIIMKDTSRAQGDFARTADQAANKSKSNAAQMEDLKAKIGQQLLPVYKTFLDLMSSVGIPTLSAFADGFAAVTSAVGGAVSLFRGLPAPLQAAALAVGAITIASRLFGTQIAGIGPKVTGLVSSMRSLGGQQRFVVTSADGLQRSYTGVGAVMQRMGQQVPTIARMHDSFIRAASGASAFPRTLGVASAAMTGMKGAATGLMGALGGPWGLAITAGVTLLTMYAGKQQEAAAEAEAHKNAVRSLTEALIANNGVLDEQAKQSLILDAQQSGLYDKLEKYGAKQQDITAALLGSKPAYDAVYSAVSSSDDAQQSWNETIARSAQQWNPYISAADKAAIANNGLSDSANDTLGAFDKATGKVTDAKDAYEKYKSNAKAAAAATDEVKVAQDKLTQANKDLAASLQAASDKFFGARDAARQYRDALREAKELAKKQGKEGTTSGSEKADQNQAALDQVAQDQIADLKRMYDDKASGAALKAKLDGYKKDLYAVAASFNLTGKAADDYVSQALGKIPADITTKVNAETAVAKAKLLELKGAAQQTNSQTVMIQTDAPLSGDTIAKLKAIDGVAVSTDGKSVSVDTTAPGAQQAYDLLAAVQAKADALNGKVSTVTIRNLTIDEHRTKLTTGARFDGAGNNGALILPGGVRAMADGGVRDRQAMIAPAGKYILWAEDETGGEAYIPFAQSKRPRSRRVAEQAVARLGGAVTWMADGGITDFDMGDIFQLFSSMLVDPDKLSSAKSSVAEKRSAAAEVRKDLAKVEQQIAAARKALAAARRTKSTKDDAAAMKKVNDLLEKRSDLYTKLAKANADATSAAKDYNGLMSAAKLSAGQLFNKAASQNNAINQQFINDITKIKARGFAPLALQLLNQGDADAMKVAHSLANGPLADLKAAAANVSRSGALQGQIDALKSSLSGADVSARREANAQKMALEYSAALARYGTTTVIHNGQGSGPDPALIGREVAKALAATPITAVASMDGYRVTNVVADNLNRRVGYGQTGVYAGQGSY